MVRLDPARLTEWLKLAPRYLFPLALVSGFLLFAPDRWLGPLGLAGVRDGWPQPYLGAIFLLSCALLVSALGVALWDSVVARRDEHRRMRLRKERLANLTPEERTLLRGYLDDDTRSQYLPWESGVVKGLEHEGVIYRAARISRGGTSFAYNIQPWAWKHLRENPELLAEGGP